MALNGIDFVLTVFWSAMFIAAAVVSVIGLRTIVSRFAPKLASGIAWRNIEYARILSTVFAAVYLMYGLSFSTLRGWAPIDDKGWVGLAGYLLVLLHLGALRMMADVHERECRKVARSSNPVVRQ